jgi:hypothetical protein
VNTGTVAALKEHPPMDFQQIRKPGFDTPISSAWQKIGDDVMVLVSESVESDDRIWLHVSVSRPNRLPTWADLRRVKDAFIGKDRKAIQVLPAQSEYVNIHPYVLHLFACLEGDPLPDFRRGTGI